LDDFALKKRNRYGTVLVDQKTHNVIEMIESRDVGPTVELLKNFPNIKKVTRDGSKVYAKAISEALPDAIQISDRFHLFKNLSDALKEDLTAILPGIIAKTVHNHQIFSCESRPLTKKEKSNFNRYQRKIELAKSIRERYNECGRIDMVRKELSVSYGTVKKYLINDPVPVQYEKETSLSPYFEKIYSMILQGFSGYKIFDELERDGYAGSASNLFTYIRLKRKKGEFSEDCVARRYITKLLYNRGIGDLRISEKQRETVVYYLKRNKEINAILMLATNFRIAMFSVNPNKLDAWIANAKTFKGLSKLRAFVNGVISDKEAVKNAILYDETNSLIEGVVSKIKTVKKTLYGRCDFNLLRKKILSKNQPN
jgi:transposase